MERRAPLHDPAHDDILYCHMRFSLRQNPIGLHDDLQTMELRGPQRDPSCEDILY